MAFNKTFVRNPAVPASDTQSQFGYRMEGQWDAVNVDLTAIETELDKPRAFASNTAVAPAVPGAPSLAEIATFATGGGHRNALIVYTGTNTSTDPVTYAFHVDGVGTVTPLFAPSDAASIVSPDTLTYTEATNTQIDFVVNGVTAGMVTETAGVPKWTLNGILDPVAYAGTARTIAQRNALTPAAGWLVYVVDGAINEYQMWDGAAWVSLGADPQITLWTSGATYASGDMVYSADRLYIADGPHTAGATFAGDIGSWRELSRAPLTVFASNAVVSPAVPGNPTEAEIGAVLGLISAASGNVFVRYTGTATSTDPVTHVFWVDPEPGLAVTLLRSPATASLYRGSLVSLAALTALTTVSLTAGEAYRVGDTLWVWDPAATTSSGGIQPADTAFPGITPGYWVSTSGHYKGAYSTSAPYSANDIVFHGGALWRANSAREAGVWGAAPIEAPSGFNSWTRVTSPVKGPFSSAQSYALGDVVYDASGLIGPVPGLYRADAAFTAGALPDMDTWSPIAVRPIYRGDYGAAEYAVGDVVQYLGDLYRCVVAHGSNSFGGPFTPANWSLLSAGPSWEFSTNNIQTVAGHWYIIDGAHTVLMPIAPVDGASVQFASPVEWSIRGATFTAAGATTVGAGQTGMFAGFDVIEMTYSATGDNWVVHAGSGSAPQADTIQNLNATGTVTAWGSVVVIGATAPTANMVLTLPTAAGNTGKTIKLVRVDNTAFTVTLAAQGGETVTLLSTGSELNTQHGSLTVEATTATEIRQVAQVSAGSAAVVASFMRGRRTSGQSVAASNAVVFTTVDSSAGTDISLNTTTGHITLKAGKTYRLVGSVVTSITAAQRTQWRWHNLTAGLGIGAAQVFYSPADTAANSASGSPATAIISPSVDTVVLLQNASLLTSDAGGNPDFGAGASVHPWFEVEVIGGQESAVVVPATPLHWAQLRRNDGLQGTSNDWVVGTRVGSGTTAWATVEGSGAVAAANGTITLAQAGRYLIEAQINDFDSSASTNAVWQLRSNGAALHTTGFETVTGADPFYPMSIVADLPTGAVLDVFPTTVGAGAGTKRLGTGSFFRATQLPAATLVDPGLITPTALSRLSLRRASTTLSTALNTITVAPSNASNTVYAVGQRVPFTAADITASTGTSFTTGTNTLTCAKAGTYQFRVQTLLTSASGSFKVTQMTRSGALVDLAVQGVAAGFHGGNDILYTATFAIGDVIDFRVTDGTATSVGLHRLAVDIDELPFATIGDVSVPVVGDWPSQPGTLTATTVNPTKGTAVEDSLTHFAVGKKLTVQYTYTQTAAGIAGTGAYLIAIPSGYTVDVTKVAVNTNPGTTLGGTTLGVGTVASGPSVVSTTAAYAAKVVAYDSTHLALQIMGGTLIAVWGSSSQTLASPSLHVSFTAEIPIL